MRKTYFLYKGEFRESIQSNDNDLNDNEINDNAINNEDEDIIDVDFNLKKKFDFEVKDILDINEYLLELINFQSIVFISKNNFEKKFEIIEECLDILFSIF